MTGEPPPATAPLDFARGFRFVLEDPDWIRKLLMGGLFALLSAVLVGAPFVAGYWVRLVRNVARGVARPLPEWDDLGGMFRDGLRALAVYLAHFLAALLLPASAGCFLAFLVGGLFRSAGPSGRASDLLGVLAGGGLIVLYGLAAVLLLVLSLYVPAALLRFVLHDRVEEAFKVRENLALIRRNLGDYFLALVLYLLASFASQFGILLCCVGVFPLGFWALCILGWGMGEVARLDRQREA